MITKPLPSQRYAKNDLLHNYVDARARLEKVKGTKFEDLTKYQKETNTHWAVGKYVLSWVTPQYSNTWDSNFQRLKSFIYENFPELPKPDVYKLCHTHLDPAISKARDLTDDEQKAFKAECVSILE